MKKITICIFIFIMSIQLLGCGISEETTSYSSDLTNIEVGQEINRAGRESITTNGLSNQNNFEIRHEFNRDGQEVFSVLADPALKAGEPFGYIFSFQEPFNVFEGKELSITAVNQENGERIQALDPLKITEPSSGYSSLQRFTTTFEIPYGGLWTYEVYLDGDGYGEVAVDIADEENPFEKQLTRIDIQVVSGAGKYGEKVLITDSEILDELKNTFEQVKWDPTIEVMMAGREDLKATISMKLEENKPEEIYEYRIWFNEGGTTSILSNNLKENYGRLDVENTKVLKLILTDVN